MAATLFEDFLLNGAVVFAEDCLQLAADSVRGICPPWLILLGFIDVDVLPAAPIEDFFEIGSMALGFDILAELIRKSRSILVDQCSTRRSPLWREW